MPIYVAVFTKCVTHIVCITSVALFFPLITPVIMQASLVSLVRFHFLYALYYDFPLLFYFFATHGNSFSMLLL